MILILLFVKNAIETIEERSESMPTIRDIAKIARVSPATVSRVLNFDETLSVQDNTKKRIFEVAEKLNYQPTSKNKIKKVEKIFGLVSLYERTKEITDPYFLSIRMGIEQRCKEKNILVKKVYNYEDSNYRQILENVDGLILMGRFTKFEMSYFTQITDHIVIIDASPDPSIYDSVISDFELATKKVIDYFVANGHKRIAFLGAKNWHGWMCDKKFLLDERVHAFEEYMKHQDLYNEDLIRIGEFTSASGYAMMKEILNNKVSPTAVFASNDMMAIGAMKAINEAGLNIPADISIIGFDDIPTTDYLTPALSTTKIFTELMGESGVNLLLDRIESDRKIPIKIVLPTELIIKGS